jgi:TPR repeat protein
MVGRFRPGRVSYEDEAFEQQERRQSLRVEQDVIEGRGYYGNELGGPIGAGIRDGVGISGIEGLRDDADSDKLLSLSGSSSSGSVVSVKQVRRESFRSTTHTGTDLNILPIQGDDLHILPIDEREREYAGSRRSRRSSVHSTRYTQQNESEVITTTQVSRKRSRHAIFHPDILKCRERCSDPFRFTTTYSTSVHVERYVAEFTSQPHRADSYWSSWSSESNYETLFHLSRAYAHMATSTSTTLTVSLRRSYEFRAIKILKHIAFPTSFMGIKYGPNRLAEAQVYLGHVYAEGRLGKAINHNKAYRLFLLAAKAGNPEANYAVARCCELGHGCKRNFKRHVKYLERSARANYHYAMHKYSLLLINGSVGFPRNPLQGRLYLERVVKITKESHGLYLYDLGSLYDDHPNPNFRSDHERAFDFYYRAANLGYSKAQYKLGSCYESGHLVYEVNHQESFYWYARAAEQSCHKAQLKLSSFYRRGIDYVVQKDEKRAFQWALQAAGQSYAEAEYQVGYYYHYGVGIQVDYSQARRWYIRAANRNYNLAHDRLRELRDY